LKEGACKPRDVEKTLFCIGINVSVWFGILRKRFWHACLVPGKHSSKLMPVLAVGYDTPEKSNPK